MFYKYPSLTNIQIEKEYEHIPLDTIVTVSEKIDGSNCQLMVTEDNFRFASRNQLVGDDWNNIGETLQFHIRRLVEVCRDYITGYDEITTVTLYGEIFSSGILKRLPYGKTRVRFFDIAFNGRLQRHEFFCDNVPIFEELKVPAATMTLGEALKIDPETFHSQFSTNGESEGYVIKGFFDTMIDRYGRVLILKSKSNRFMETRPTGTRKEANQKSELAAPVASKLTENRVISALSRLGLEKDIRNIGVLIKEVSLDIQEEVKRENEFEIIQTKLLNTEVANLVKSFIFS
jgi:hypothetical protein